MRPDPPDTVDPDQASLTGGAFGSDVSTVPSSAAGSLLVGVICGPAVFEAWQMETLRRMAAVDGVTIGAVIRVCDPAGVEPAEGLVPRSWLWKRYRALSARIHQRWAQAPVEVPEFMMGVPEISCTAEARDGDSLSFAESDLSVIRRLELDAILYFGVELLRGEILDSAEHGIWSFDHLGLEVYPGCPVGFWDVYHDRELTAVRLRRLADQPSDEVILYTRSFHTDRCSCTVTAQHIIWRMVDWPAAVCRRLVFASGGGAEERAPDFGDANRAPSAQQTCIHVAQTMKRLVAKQVRDAFLESPGPKDRWALGVVDHRVEDLFNPVSQPTARWIKAPPGGFFADPFAAQVNGKTLIFCEHWDDESRKGHIAVIESPDLKAFEEPYPVIEEPFHLSYPFVVQELGDWYCVPEQHQQGDIALYRAVDFPGTWERCGVLVSEFLGIDPTLIQVEGMWWMFAACAGDEMGAAESSLFAFYSVSIHGPWTPHRSNPVVERRGRSRPAGRVFWSKGRLIRPVQECVKAYGEAILFYEISALSQSEFAERLIGRWERSDEWPFPSGMHHIERLDHGGVLIDAKRYPGVRPTPGSAISEKFSMLRQRVGNRLGR